MQQKTRRRSLNALFQRYARGQTDRQTDRPTGRLIIITPFLYQGRSNEREKRARLCLYTVLRAVHLWHLWFLCAAYKCTYLLRPTYLQCIVRCAVYCSFRSCVCGHVQREAPVPASFTCFQRSDLLLTPSRGWWMLASCNWKSATGQRDVARDQGRGDYRKPAQQSHGTRFALCSHVNPWALLLSRTVSPNYCKKNLTV